VRSRWTAALLLAVLASPAAAQLPAQKRQLLNAAQRGRTDTTRTPRDTLSDTARAGRGTGLPTGPSRSFETADSVEQELQRREGFRLTRYSADSVQFLPPSKEIRMAGDVLVQRDVTTLEADTVHYASEHCVLTAHGSPRLFDQTGVMVGHGMVYDACNHTGIIGKAKTDFKESNATWYLHGDLAVDNEQNRVYGASSTITSCDLPDPHYHFAAREVKYVTKNLMVARPAVLYVADVPVLWLPFIFQDMRHGRHSGLIPPQFGLNDIVRNSPTYHRHISNLGYYWAINDYADAQVTMDWYAQQFITLNGRVRYRWLNRFITGGIAFQELHQFNGLTSKRISWSHQQDFSLESRLTANIDYATSSSIISRNAVDPVLAVSTIDSRVNFQQRFSWGSLSLGGSRTQSLDKPQVVMSLPVVAFTPNPIALSQSVTWSPTFTLSNALQNHAASNMYTFSGQLGDSTNRLLNTRSTSLAIGTPIRFGRWNWANAISVQDQYSNQRQTVNLPDPADTTRRLVRTYDQTFETDIDWSTGIGLPMLFQGSWNLQPSISVVNTTGGPFMLRNRYSGGGFVTQGKRLAYTVAIAPTFYGLFPGFGPIARIRHSISPSLSWSYSPAAKVPLAYARAVAQGGPVNTRSLATQTITLGLNQNFEAKLKPPAPPPGADSARADTSGTEPQARKIKLLSIQTSAVAFDLEQAKQPGHTGWVTGSMTNTFSTDLLRGFSFTTTHSLFDGQAGVAGSRFHPYLTSLSMRFGLSGGAFSWLGSLLGLSSGTPEQPTAEEQARRDSARAGRDTLALPTLFPDAYQRGPLSDTPTAFSRLAPRTGRTGINASLAFDLSRQRPTVSTAGGDTTVIATTHSTLSASVSFAPTRHWSVSWQTMYDFQAHRFGSHVLRFDRDLHDWRATFSFVQAPNGNVVFNFNISLTPQPEIKFDYDQRNIPIQ
jgi:hypothetical protein